MARRWPGKKESPSRLIKSTLAAGISGWSSSTEPTTPSTPVWKSSLPLNDYASAVLSCTRFREETSGRKESWEERPGRPSTMWQRTLWRVTGSAPSSTNGKIHINIDRQTKGYKKEDPSTKHQKALPPVVFNKILDMSFLPRRLARAWLVCASLFFAMRTYEYYFVGTDERKTQAIRACDVTFQNGA